MRKKLPTFLLALMLVLILTVTTVTANSVLTDVHGSGDVTCDIGATATFSVTARYTQGSASDLRYAWYFATAGSVGSPLRDGNGISGSSTSTLRVTASQDRVGSYYAVVTMHDETLNSPYMYLMLSSGTPTQGGNQNGAIPEMPNPRITTGEDSICVDWLQVKAGDGFAKKYGIRIDNEAPKEVSNTPYGSNIIYFRGLTAGTEYTIELWAENADGVKGPSYIKTVKTWGTAPGTSDKKDDDKDTLDKDDTADNTPDDSNEPESPANNTNDAPLPFADIAKDAWYRSDVEKAYKSGLISGKNATSFAPNDNMTVAEAVKLAACMHQLYHDGEVTLENGSSQWYMSYMDYALENGIIPSEHTIDRANDIISRKEFVDIFYSSLPDQEYKVINSIADGWIPDIDQSLTYSYVKSVYIFYRAGILTGSDDNGTFNPDSNIKRSEVAAIVTRMMDADSRKII